MTDSLLSDGKPATYYCNFGKEEWKDWNESEQTPAEKNTEHLENHHLPPLIIDNFIHLNKRDQFVDNSRNIKLISDLVGFFWKSVDLSIDLNEKK